MFFYAAISKQPGFYVINIGEEKKLKGFFLQKLRDNPRQQYTDNWQSNLDMTFPGGVLKKLDS